MSSLLYLLFIIAGSIFGWLIPEFMSMLSPRSTRALTAFNIMMAFVGAVFAMTIHEVLFKH